MGRPVMKTSSAEQPRLCINDNPEQPESSRSKRLRKLEKLGSGKRMVDAQGKTKFKASSLQRNKGGGKRKAGVKAGNNDLKLGKCMRNLRRREAKLVKENEKLKSAVTALEQQIEQVEQQIEQVERLKNVMIDALVPRTCPKERSAAIKLTPRGTGISKTEVLETDIKQIRANEKQLKRDNAVLCSKLTDLALRLRCLSSSLKIDNKTPCNEELAANKDVTAGKGTNPPVTSTCDPTSSTSSSHFMSWVCWIFCKFGTQFGTALVNRLAAALVKHMEDFLASSLAQEKERI